MTNWLASPGAIVMVSGVSLSVAVAVVAPDLVPLSLPVSVAAMIWGIVHEILHHVPRHAKWVRDNERLGYPVYKAMAHFDPVDKWLVSHYLRTGQNIPADILLFVPRLLGFLRKGTALMPVAQEVYQDGQWYVVIDGKTSK